jgi:hypothetical protein
MPNRQSDTLKALWEGHTVVDSTASQTADSISAEVKVFPSLLSGAENVEVINEKAIPANHTPFWIPLILVLGFAMIAWVRLFFWRRLQMIFKAVFARNFANQLIREGNLFNERPGLILYIVYLMVMAMLAYQSLVLFNVELSFPGWITYLLLVGFFTALWFFKLTLVNALSILFNTRDHSRILLANMYLYNLFTGIILLPLVSIMSFAQPLIAFYISLAFIGFIYSLRLFRLAMTGIGIIKFSVFHLILYLCTLEILPLIVLAKILTRNINL